MLRQSTNSAGCPNSASPAGERSAWLERVDYENVFEDREYATLKLLPYYGRRFVWKLTYALMGVNATNGVAGHACSLYERYIASYVRNRDNLTPCTIEWWLTKSNLKEDLLLLVGICIMLSSKTVLTSVAVYPWTLKDILQRDYAKVYSLEKIMMTETRVFFDLQSRLPLWTNGDKAHMLAQELEMEDILLEAVTILMDIADFYRDSIEEKIKLASICTLETSDDTFEMNGLIMHTENVRNIHLVGGVVAATGQSFSFPRTDSMARIAELVRAPVAYISRIASVILQFTLDQPLPTDTWCDPNGSALDVLRQKQTGLYLF